MDSQFAEKVHVGNKNRGSGKAVHHTFVSCPQLHKLSSLDKLSDSCSGCKTIRSNFSHLEKMKFLLKVKSKPKTPVEKVSAKTTYASAGISNSTPISESVENQLENSAAVASYMEKFKDLPQDICRHFVTEQLNLIENFEKEKEELRQTHDREKNAIKKAYENERKDLIAELEKARELIGSNYEEIKLDFQGKIENQAEEIKRNSNLELSEQKKSLHEQWMLVGDIEAELQRIGKEMLLVLQTLSPEEASNIDSALKSKLAIDKSCLASLRQIFQNKTQRQERIVNGEWNDNIERKESTGSNELPIRDLEVTYNRDLDDLTNIFRRQKSEIMDMFALEKEELEQQLEKEKEKYKEEVDANCQLAMDQERKEWQDTIREYQREIDILRYQRDQMDRNYCIELDNMKMEFENEKICLYKKFMKERDSLKRNISDKISHALFADVQNKTEQN